MFRKTNLMRDILIRSYVSSHAFINVEKFCKTSLFSFYKTYEFFNIKRYFVLKHFIVNIKYSNYVKSRFCAIMQIIPITAILFELVFANLKFYTRHSGIIGLSKFIICFMHILVSIASFKTICPTFYLNYSVDTSK